MSVIPYMDVSACAAFQLMTTCACCCSRVEEVARLTEDLGQLNASGKLSCILVQQHLESILRHKAENQSLEAEILRLRGIEVCGGILLAEIG